ncbi:MAG: LCP family protein [Armatimonadia bacterium]
MMKDYLIYLLVSLIVASGAFGLYDDVAVSAGGLDQKKDQKSLAALPEPFAGVERMHLVLMGADDRPGEPGRSDTLMVVWLNPEQKRAAIMSIPRDTRVDIPNHGSTKINHAYAYGGPKLTTMTVEQLLGVTTDGYVKVNFEGFVKAVDVLGGVDVVVQDVEGEGRGMNYDDNWGNLHVHLKPGPQHLDGYQVMGYCRYRKSNYHNLGDGDGGRAKRQQEFLRAIVQQKLKVSNLPALLSAGRTIMGCLDTNLSWRQCVDLMRLLKSMNTADIKTVTIPVVAAPSGGIYYSQIIDSAFREMLSEIDRHLDGQDTATCAVEVLNGSGVPGTAKKAADVLEAAGFEIAKVGDAPSGDYEATELTYSSEAESSATAAAEALGVGTAEAANGISVSTAPLQVIVGKDFVR